jgi:hypothetical protein
MTFKEFINQFDQENSIVLLEGKRSVLEKDKKKLTALGKLLASKTVITPYAEHRQKTNQASETISLDEINIAAEPKVIVQSKQNKATERLIDQFVSGDKNRLTIKAAYIIRDTIKAIGTTDILPATFGIFYDDLKNPMTGGTGHTMNVCEQNNIPIIDQKVWFKWLTE